MNSMIKAENLKYEYIRTFDDDEKAHTEVITALDNVSVSIEKGSFVAILGHNGSGKSTFAKLINGLVSPSGGSLWVNGYDTKRHITLFVDYFYMLISSVSVLFIEITNYLWGRDWYCFISKHWSHLNCWAGINIKHSKNKNKKNSKTHEHTVLKRTKTF